MCLLFCSNLLPLHTVNYNLKFNSFAVIVILPSFTDWYFSYVICSFHWFSTFLLFSYAFRFCNPSVKNDPDNLAILHPSISVWIKAYLLHLLSLFLYWCSGLPWPFSSTSNCRILKSRYASKIVTASIFFHINNSEMYLHNVMDYIFLLCFISKHISLLGLIPSIINCYVWITAWRLLIILYGIELINKIWRSPASEHRRHVNSNFLALYSSTRRLSSNLSILSRLQWVYNAHSHSLKVVLGIILFVREFGKSMVEVLKILTRKNLDTAGQFS